VEFALDTVARLKEPDEADVRVDALLALHPDPLVDLNRALRDNMSDTPGVQTPEPIPPRPVETGPGEVPDEPLPRYAGWLWGFGGRLTWVSGLVLAVSAFTGWYAGSEVDGLTISVIGWHTGVLGKLVFFIGLAVLALVALREAGIDLPATVPDSLVVIGLGALATIFVLVRLISIPDTFLPASGRGVGIYISLLAALAVIVAGLVRAAEEL
jgi:hypothetical protein